MSVDKRRLDHDAQPGYGDSEQSPNPLSSSDSGLRGLLKRHFETWSKLYVEQQVEARTRRHH